MYIVIPILLMWKLKHREIRVTYCGHAASSGRGRSQTQADFASQPGTVLLSCL